MSKYQLIVDGRMVALQGSKIEVFEPTTPFISRVEGERLQVQWVDEENQTLMSRIVTFRGTSASCVLSRYDRDRRNAYINHGRSHQDNPLDSVSMTSMWWQSVSLSSNMWAELGESGITIVIHNVDRLDRDKIRFLRDFGTLHFFSNSREAHFTPDLRAFRSGYARRDTVAAILTDLNERVL